MAILSQHKYLMPFSCLLLLESGSSKVVERHCSPLARSNDSQWPNVVELKSSTTNRKEIQRVREPAGWILTVFEHVRSRSVTRERPCENGRDVSSDEQSPLPVQSDLRISHYLHSFSQFGREHIQQARCFKSPKTNLIPEDGSDPFKVGATVSTCSTILPLLKLEWHVPSAVT